MLAVFPVLWVYIPNSVVESQLPRISHRHWRLDVVLVDELLDALHHVIRGFDSVAAVTVVFYFVAGICSLAPLAHLVILAPFIMSHISSSFLFYFSFLLFYVYDLLCRNTSRLWCSRGAAV